MALHPCTAALLTLVLHSAQGASPAQPPAGPSGHWEGAIQIPGQELKIQVNLAPAGEKWEGTIDIPAQGLKGFPLGAITVDGDKIGFAMRSVPGEPQFNGTLAADRKTLSGEFRQGGGTVPFALTRTGDARFERLPDSTPITKELEGNWEGALDISGKVLRLALRLANQPNGPAKGTLVSIDQGGAEVTITAVLQSGSRLKLHIPAIIGLFDGEFKDGQLAGLWTQGPNTWPLAFKRQP